MPVSMKRKPSDYSLIKVGTELYLLVTGSIIQYDLEKNMFDTDQKILSPFDIL